MATQIHFFPVTETVGQTAITILDVRSWRDCNPMVAHAVVGNDGCSGLYTRLRLQFENSTGNHTDLMLTATVSVQGASHPIDFYAFPEKDGTVWDGFLASGEKREVVMQSVGPNQPVSGKAEVVLQWTDATGESVSIRLPAEGIELIKETKDYPPHPP